MFIKQIDDDEVEENEWKIRDSNLPIPWVIGFHILLSFKHNVVPSSFQWNLSFSFLKFLSNVHLLWSSFQRALLLVVYFVAPKINDMRILLWAWVILTRLRFMETRRYALNYSHCYTYFPGVTHLPSTEFPSNSC